MILSGLTDYTSTKTLIQYTVHLKYSNKYIYIYMNCQFLMFDWNVILNYKLPNWIYFILLTHNKSTRQKWHVMYVWVNLTKPVNNWIIFHPKIKRKKWYVALKPIFEAQRDFLGACLCLFVIIISLIIEGKMSEWEFGVLCTILSL